MQTSVLLLWVFMLIKGYVVPLRAQGLGSGTSECAIKSLDNSSFKMDLYISSLNLESLHTVINAIFRVAVTINACWIVASVKY